jgi:16S rRNA (guanine527-N7)-methyltransferase
LPSSFAETLDAGLLVLGLRLEPWQHEAIETHVRLLVAWNAHINLTAIREPAALAREHVLDSLAATSIVKGRGAGSLADIGSGGGFPGLPLAIASPGTRATLIESTRKKAGFLDVAVTAAGLADRVRVVAARAEGLRAAGAHWIPADIVTARAVASLANLARLAAPLLAPGGALVAWKRGDVEREIADARQALAGNGFGRPEIHLVSVPDLADHRLVVVPIERPARRSGKPRGTLRR